MKNNKLVLLVHPEISRTKYNFAGIIDNEPLELEYIWSMLAEEGFEPHIWDGQVEKSPLSSVSKSCSRPWCISAAEPVRKDS